MPEKQLAKYSKSELSLLVQRKNEIGKRRLVKDAYLRDLLEPEKITPIREYKDKYVKDKKAKLPEPLPKAQAEKILKEKPIKVEKVIVEKPMKEPKVQLTAEQKREAKNQRQREKYRLENPVKEKVKKESVPKEPKAPREKVTFPRQIRPFGIVEKPVEISFD